jgi:diacylglycerol kinase (ATP)
MTIRPKIIYNPAAGKGKAGSHLDQVRALLDERGFVYDLELTQAPGHAQTLARQAAEGGRELVIAAGGDGTINETINGLMQTRQNGKIGTALGVLPIGRGNDFAFGNHIPENIAGAVDILVEGYRRPIDIGRVTGGDYPNGRYFGNVVGMGFDTIVGFEAAKFKRLNGAMSYLAAVVKTIFLYAHAPVYEIEIDGKITRQPFLMISIMNGRRVGGSFMMAPDGDPGDGIFDLCLADQVSQIRILPLAVTFMNGTQARSSAVKMTRGKRVSIRAVEGTIPAHADGETICEAGQSLEVELFPAALEVVVSKDRKHA